MDLNVFKENLIKGGLSKGIEYKNNSVPSTLYKYVPLLDDRYVNYNKENKKKLDSLKENKLWVSHYKKLNDPFEFEMLTIDIEKLKDTQWKSNYIEEFFNSIKNTILVACFSSEVDNNMPMWAHYANNHKGYCIKYSVLNANSVFPVKYENIRAKSATILTSIISEIYKAYSEGFKEPTNKFYEYFTYFYLSLNCKHNFWKYENEYRLLHFSMNTNEKYGELIDLSIAGLKVEAIYIGYNCDEEYASEIINLAKSIGCEVYKMNIDKYGNEFALIPEKLC